MMKEWIAEAELLMHLKIKRKIFSWQRQKMFFIDITVDFFLKTISQNCFAVRWLLKYFSNKAYMFHHLNVPDKHVYEIFYISLILVHDKEKIFLADRQHC